MESKDKKREKESKINKVEHFTLLSITTWNNYKSLKLSKVLEAVMGISLNGSEMIELPFLPFHLSPYPFSVKKSSA